MMLTFNKSGSLATLLIGIMLLSACGQGNDEPNGGISSNADHSENESNKVNTDNDLKSDDIWQEAFEQELHYTDEVIQTYFLGVRDGNIQLNISMARADYYFVELDVDSIDDMMHVISVEKTDELVIADKEGNELTVDDLNDGDKIYLEYDISEYDQQKNNEVEANLLVKESVSKEEMLRRVTTPKGSNQLYVGVVSREGQGWGDFDVDEMGMGFLLDYDVVRGYGDIIHRDGVPAYDYIEAFDLEEELPVVFVVGEEGLEYKSGNLEEVIEFIEAR